MSRKTQPLQRIVFLSLAVILLLGLAGCGGDKKDSPAAATASSSAKAPPPAEEPVQALFAKAKQIPGLSYDAVTTMKDMTLNSRVWLSQGKVKMEQNLQGRTFVIYFDGDDMYQYDPSSNTALKFPLRGMEGKGPKKPDVADYADYMAPDSLKVVESAVLEGVRCRVVTYTMKDNGGTVKMWIREDYGLPVRTEVSGKDGDKVVTEHKNMKVGALSPETFKLPAGVQVKDMGQMMKQLPAKP